MNEKLISTIVSTVNEKKGKNLKVFNLKGKSDVCDYQLVCSGMTQRQTKALSESIEDTVKAQLRISPSAIEGRSSGFWVVLDYGAVIVHIFLDELRDYYAIEAIWPDAEVAIQ